MYHEHLNQNYCISYQITVMTKKKSVTKTFMAQFSSYLRPNNDAKKPFFHFDSASVLLSLHDEGEPIWLSPWSVSFRRAWAFFISSFSAFFISSSCLFCISTRSRRLLSACSRNSSSCLKVFSSKSFPLSAAPLERSSFRLFCSRSSDSFTAAWASLRSCRLRCS